MIIHLSFTTLDISLVEYGYHTWYAFSKVSAHAQLEEFRLEGLHVQVTVVMRCVLSISRSMYLCLCIWNGRVRAL
jgi:hypothetical protein